MDDHTQDSRIKLVAHKTMEFHLAPMGWIVCIGIGLVVIGFVCGVMFVR